MDQACGSGDLSALGRVAVDPTRPQKGNTKSSPWAKNVGRSVRNDEQPGRDQANRAAPRAMLIAYPMDYGSCS